MNKPKKYLTKADKISKRVSSEYAEYKRNKQKEATWLNQHAQSVINTLPKRIALNFASFDFSTFNSSKFVDGKSIFITGKAGVGKTVLSSFLYVEYLKNLYYNYGLANKQYYFVNFPKFIDNMQNKANEQHTFDVNIVKKYCECDLLVLDDFGVKKMTDYVYGLTYLVINERYDNTLPTIINSNHSLEELNELMDDRIVRRIEEDYLIINKN